MPARGERRFAIRQAHSPRELSDRPSISTAPRPHHVLTIAALLTGLRVAHAEPDDRGSAGLPTAGLPTGDRPGDRTASHTDPAPSPRGTALTEAVPAPPPPLWPRGMQKLESGMTCDLGDVLALGLGATALSSGVLMLLHARPLEKVRMLRPGGGVGVALRLRF